MDAMIREMKRTRKLTGMVQVTSNGANNGDLTGNHPVGIKYPGATASADTSTR